MRAERTELLPLRLALERDLSSSVQDNVHELVESLRSEKGDKSLISRAVCECKLRGREEVRVEVEVACTDDDGSLHPRVNVVIQPDLNLGFLHSHGG